ncbi:MAG: DUF86 domain-containing protein [Methanomicrobiales archaeon]
MSERRTLQLFLDDMGNAIHRILYFIQDMTYEEFLQDVKTQDAVLRNIQVMGDAATNISPEICLLYQDIDWKYIVGMRNLITHRYFDVDLWILWTTITEDLPRLERQLKTIIVK